MSDDPEENLRREEFSARVRDLSERFALDIDEGRYNPYEATQALILTAAVLCVDDRHFRALVGFLCESWDRVAAAREDNAEDE